VWIGFKWHRVENSNRSSMTFGFHKKKKIFNSDYQLLPPDDVSLLGTHFMLHV
jgi:hypothetical protein